MPGVVDSLQEMIADAAITGASVNIVHINSMSNKLTPLTLEMIHDAQARGLDVTTEAYPYIAGATSAMPANKATIAATTTERMRRIGSMKSHRQVP